MTEDQTKQSKNGRERMLRKIFNIGVSLKGIDGILEIAGGLILYFASVSRINKIVTLLTQHELSEDPKDFIAMHIVNSAATISVSAKTFSVFYLIIHGIIKIFLVWGLLKNKLLAYPVSMAFFIAFIIYQSYRYYNTHAFWLVLLTIFDIIILVLTWHEYQWIKKQKNL